MSALADAMLVSRDLHSKSPLIYITLSRYGDASTSGAALTLLS